VAGALRLAEKRRRKKVMASFFILVVWVILGLMLLVGVLGSGSESES
jgi:hypothetical protein